MDKGGKAVVKAADVNVKKRASHWIRPPFAINELEFLLACTRCNDCVDACPHNVIFNLSARVGASAAGTPALDLLNKGCHLCEDWPCVIACTVNALHIEQLISSDEDSEQNSESMNPSQVTPPKLSFASLNKEICLPYSGPECGACIDSCPLEGALTIHDNKPAIIEENCNGCGLCREVCITEPKAITIASL